MKAIIISGNLAQDHEFIYPYYRLLEEGIEVDVCMLEGKPVKGFLGTTLPPNKDQKVKNINQVKTKDYKILVLPSHPGLTKIHQIKIIKIINNYFKNKE